MDKRSSAKNEQGMYPSALDYNAAPCSLHASQPLRTLKWTARVTVHFSKHSYEGRSPTSAKKLHRRSDQGK